MYTTSEKYMDLTLPVLPHAALNFWIFSPRLKRPKNKSTTNYYELDVLYMYMKLFAWVTWMCKKNQANKVIHWRQG